jgi:hypothetical protein
LFNGCATPTLSPINIWYGDKHGPASTDRDFQACQLDPQHRAIHGSVTSWRHPDRIRDLGSSSSLVVESPCARLVSLQQAALVNQVGLYKAIGGGLVEHSQI